MREMENWIKEAAAREAVVAAADAKRVKGGDRVVKVGRDSYYARTVMRVIKGDGVEVREPGGNWAFYADGTYKIIEGKN